MNTQAENIKHMTCYLGYKRIKAFYRNQSMWEVAGGFHNDSIFREGFGFCPVFNNSLVS